MKAVDTYFKLKPVFRWKRVRLRFECPKRNNKSWDLRGRATNWMINRDAHLESLGLNFICEDDASAGKKAISINDTFLTVILNRTEARLINGRVTRNKDKGFSVRSYKMTMAT